jgi:glutathione S-transferase
MPTAPLAAQHTRTTSNMCAREQGLDLPLKMVDLSKGEHKTPEYTAKAIWGVIPLLETTDGSWWLYESRAICRFLASKYKEGNPALLGRNLEEYAVIEQWLSVEASNFDSCASALCAELVFKPMFHRGEPDPAVVKVLVGKLTACMDVYEKHLAKGSPYLCGNDFTLADLVHLPYAGMVIAATPHGDIFKTRPNVWKWWERISSRPSWKAVNP